MQTFIASITNLIYVHICIYIHIYYTHLINNVVNYSINGFTIKNSTA